MTIELKFYDTFGIEPKIDYEYKTIIQNVTKTGYWFDKEYLIKMFNDNQKIKVIQVRKNINYPDITTKKLLEMICIINKSKFVRTVYLDDCNYTALKNTIIKKTITIMKNEFLNKKLKDEFKHQIQQLFKD